MSIEKLMDWENMNVAGIIYIMVKWLNIHHVEFKTYRRDNVESGVWYEIMIYNENYHPQWTVSSQKLDLLKARLINTLDKKGYRDFLKKG